MLCKVASGSLVAVRWRKAIDGGFLQILLDFFLKTWYHIENKRQKPHSAEKGENMQLLESGQMYLETVYLLSKKKANVRSIDICEEMGFSKPSVSRAVSLLRSGGYLNMDKDGYLTLTETGLEVASKMYERHGLLTSFLVSLGVPEDIAEEDACKIEHHISDASFDAIKKHIDNK